MQSEELIQIVESHQLWLKSGGKEGRQARLEEVNFGATIELRGTNFRNAILNKAELKNADLTETNLQGAELRRASFDGAILRGTNLREADLQNTNLENGEFLLTAQLAGANVAGAKLPKPIAEFDGLKTIAEATSNAQKLFIAMLSGCLYSWLTIATTKDAALLTNSASSPLPIIGTALPIVGFYLVAPVVLLALYFYFHLNMQRLWEALADLPAVFPDGRSLNKRADPWLLNGLVSAHFVRLRCERPSLSRVQQCLSILLAWWVVPATLFVFWGRFLVRHDWFATGLHVGLVAAAIGFGWMSYRLACTTLRGASHRPFFWAHVWKDVRAYKRAAGILGTCVVGFVLYCISLGGIEGIESYEKEPGIGAPAPEKGVAVLPFDNFSEERQSAFFTDGVQDEILTQLAKIPDLRVISRTSVMPYKGRAENLREIARILGVSHIVKGGVRRRDDRISVSVDLFDARTDSHVWAARYDRAYEGIFMIEDEIVKDIMAQLKTKLSPDEKVYVEEPPKASRLSLRAFMPHALKFIGFSPFANLIQVDVSTKPANWTGKIEEYALVKGARLVEAEMQFANARSAFLANADLFQANLNGANLDSASFAYAKLSHANLSNVFAPHVSLSSANLENARLENAHLEDAHLENANLSEANLSNADLFQANLSNIILLKAKLVGAHLEYADLSKANLLQANLETATLWNATLQGANFQDANLSKADLWKANLENADLSSAVLSNANLSNANLSNAKLWNANLRNASLSDANLSHADFSSADLGGATLLDAEVGGAIFHKTILKGANLTRAKKLTRAQLQEAITDEKTILPADLPP